MKYRMYLPEGVLKGFKKSHEKVSIKWISPDEFLKETSVYEHLRPYEGERKLKLKENSQYYLLKNLRNAAALSLIRKLLRHS